MTKLYPKCAFDKQKPIEAMESKGEKK